MDKKNSYNSIECQICHKRFVSLVSHIKSHKITCEEYKKQFNTNNLTSQKYKDDMSKSLKQVIDNDPDYLRRVSEGVKRSLLRPETIINKKNGYDKWKKENPDAYLKGIKRRKEGLHNYLDNLSNDDKKQLSKRSSETAKKTWSNKRSLMIEKINEANAKSETTKKRSEAMTQYRASMTKEQLNEESKRIKERINKPENRENFLKWGLAGSKAAKSPKAVTKRNKTNQTSETKKKRSLAAIERVKKIPKISSLNIKFEKAMKKAGLIFESEYQIAFYLVDFYFSKYQLVVEVDGDYWHGNPIIYSKEKQANKKVLNKSQLNRIYKDKSERTYLENRGYTLLRFWESDINENIDKCINEVLKYVK